ncbi:MAG: pyridoxal phosphate-dependent aminotransferase [Thermoanaerobaculia bacterium]
MDAPEVHLNLNVRGLSPSATVAIHELSNELRAHGRRIFRLGLGQSPFPVPAPVVEALRRQAGQKDYLPVRGLRELKSAVAKHYREAFDIERSASGVLVGPGSKELMFLLQLVYYGDLVIPTPTWVSYAPQAQILGRQVRLLPTRKETGWRLTAEQLDGLCRKDPTRPRLVILTYPSNPTGLSYDDDELAELAEIARRYRVILLADEIYGRLDHGGTYRSIARYYPEGTILSSGLSKWCGAGGWRLGIFLFPEVLSWLLDAMAVVASESFTSTAAPIQHASVVAFEGGPEIEDYLKRSRTVLRALARRLVRRLEAAGVDVRLPDGAFYLFPDFGPFRERLAARGIHDGQTLCERLLEETGVAILPGSAFGRPEEELTARLAYVDFDGARALEAVASLADGEEPDDALLEDSCADLFEAIDRLCDWLQNSDS